MVQEWRERDPDWERRRFDDVEQRIKAYKWMDGDDGGSGRSIPNQYDIY